MCEGGGMVKYVWCVCVCEGGGMVKYVCVCVCVCEGGGMVKYVWCGCVEYGQCGKATI